MTQIRPDFFLSSSGEYDLLSDPRACWVRSRLHNEFRDDYMLIEISPPLIGQGFGLGAQDITQLIISTRHQGYTLYPISEWPSHVYVIRLLDESVLKTLSFTKEQVELIAWAMIFPTLKAAEDHVMKSPFK